MNNKTSLLVTGASGYLGRYLTARAALSFGVYSAYSHYGGRIKAGQPVPLDLTRRAAVHRCITDLSPQVIIHAAAINPGSGDDGMMQVNSQGARYVAEAAVEVGARLVHVSSDVIHSGQNPPYADDDPPTPVNLYGRSKAEGEAAVAEIAPGAAIVRTSLIYGLDEMDRGTAGFVERLTAGQPLILFNDVIRQPVWVETLVTALLRLARSDFAGRLNVAGRQALTREEFGRRMLAWWNIDPRGLLQPGRAADISNTIPLDIRLSVSKGERLLDMTFPGVDEVLAGTKRSSL